jgi:hypothetical protein
VPGRLSVRLFRLGCAIPRVLTPSITPGTAVIYSESRQRTRSRRYQGATILYGCSANCWCLLAGWTSCHLTDTARFNIPQRATQIFSKSSHSSLKRCMLMWRRNEGCNVDFPRSITCIFTSIAHNQVLCPSTIEKPEGNHHYPCARMRLLAKVHKC